MDRYSVRLCCRGIHLSVLNCFICGSYASLVVHSCNFLVRSVHHGVETDAILSMVRPV